MDARGIHYVRSNAHCERCKADFFEVLHGMKIFNAFCEAPHKGDVEDLYHNRCGGSACNAEGNNKKIIENNIAERGKPHELCDLALTVMPQNIITDERAGEDKKNRRHKYLEGECSGHVFIAEDDAHNRVAKHNAARCERECHKERHRHCAFHNVPCADRFLVDNRAGERGEDTGGKNGGKCVEDLHNALSCRIEADVGCGREPAQHKNVCIQHKCAKESDNRDRPGGGENGTHKLQAEVFYDMEEFFAEHKYCGEHSETRACDIRRGNCLRGLNVAEHDEAECRDCDIHKERYECLILHFFFRAEECV